MSYSPYGKSFIGHCGSDVVGGVVEVELQQDRIRPVAERDECSIHGEGEEEQQPYGYSKAQVLDKCVAVVWTNNCGRCGTRISRAECC